MHSIWLAILWQFWRRHFVALILSAIIPIVIWGALQFPMGQPLSTLLGSLPLVQMVYLIAIFSFGCDCDLFRCESSYPRHMLRLPLATPWLASWPFLFGTIAIVLNWIALQWLVMVPIAATRNVSHFGPPAVLTPTVMIAILAWTQATLWASHRHAAPRVVAATLAMVVPLWGAFALVLAGLPEAVAAGCFIVWAMVGHFATIGCLSRARSGAVVPWPRVRLHPVVGGGRRTRRRLVFGSTVQAQVWYEWRRYLVPLVAITVLFTGMFFVMSLQWPHSRFPRDGLLIAPILVSSIACLGIGGLNHHAGDRHVSPFFAAHPFSSFQYVFAKWLAAGVATTLVCGVALAAFTFLAFWTGNVASWWAERWTLAVEHHSTNKAVIGFAFVVIVYPVLTWVFLVQAMPIKLSGRYWLETLLVWIGIGIAALLVLATNLDNPVLLPWTVGTLLTLKGLAAVSTLRKVRREGVVGNKAIYAFLVAWFLVVSTCVGMVYWFELTRSSRSFLLVVGVIVLIWPITRIASAPLALHANRHA